MNKRPTQANELLAALMHIFPEFGDETQLKADDAELKRSTIFSEFTPFFGAHVNDFSPEQLRQLGTLVNEAVAVDDSFQRAVVAGFLEHLHRIKAYGAFSSYLNAHARAKARA